MSKKPKFLFIQPPYERLKGLSIQNPPLGLLYLATVLDEKGYEARVYDCDATFEESRVPYSNEERIRRQREYLRNINEDGHPAWVDLKEVLRKERPDILGVSVMTPTWRSACRVLSIARAVLPSSQRLVGGPHITIVGTHAAFQCPDVDFALAGEGEESILAFAHALECSYPFHSIAGLAWRQDGKILGGGRAPGIECLDSLPIPNRELLINHERYRPNSLAYMIASRGCPYSCQFCASVPMWERKVRIRSAESVMQEIEYLVNRYNIRGFDFWDDTFTAIRENLLLFCSLLIQRYGERYFHWSCLANVKTIDEEILTILKRAGCYRMRIGVESGSDRILSRIEKRTNRKELLHAAHLIKIRNVSSRLFYGWNPL